jgi:hypothetical protein
MPDNASRKQTPGSNEVTGAGATESGSIQPLDLANASHELRTPLSALLMAIEMLRATELDEHQRTLLETALHATTDMKRSTTWSKQPALAICPVVSKLNVLMATSCCPTALTA